jgi:hypothetical protein
MKDDHIRMQEALLSLHEQAHGDNPMRFCQAEPCRSLHYDEQGFESELIPSGPAPRTAGAF